jgi:hypothetical protein
LQGATRTTAMKALTAFQAQLIRLRVGSSLALLLQGTKPLYVTRVR